MMNWELKMPSPALLLFPITDLFANKQSQQNYNSLNQVSLTEMKKPLLNFKQRLFSPQFSELGHIANSPIQQ